MILVFLQLNSKSFIWFSYFMFRFQKIPGLLKFHIFSLHQKCNYNGGTTRHTQVAMHKYLTLACNGTSYELIRQI